MGLRAEPKPPDLAALTPQELAVYRALEQARGGFLTRHQLEVLVPSRDHVGQRDYRLMSVIVHRIRRKLGADVIVNEWGRGYRIGPAVA